jgi:phosphohistidine swiveling domain-containing protein
MMAKNKPKSVDDPEKLRSSVDNLINSIIEQFNLISGRPEQVKKNCDNLRLYIRETYLETTDINLEPLLPLLQKRVGPIAEYLFSLLKEMTELDNNPTILVKAMLQSRDKNLALQALKLAVHLCDKGNLQITPAFLQFLSDRLKMEKSPFNEKDAIHDIVLLAKRYKSGEESRYKDPLLGLYIDKKNADIRYLAARLLDSSGKAVSSKIAISILGTKNYKLLCPYLSYTRATYLDLLCLQFSSALINDFLRAEKIIGENLLYKVITKVGWNRLNLGLKVQSMIAVTIDGLPPYMVSETEVSLFEKLDHAVLSSPVYLIITCGGQVAAESKVDIKDDPITRFRSYNLNHAALLSDFLDVAPLTTRKVREMINRMDRIVNDYITLFNRFSDECSILANLYNELKNKIFAELDETTDDQQFSPELTRLVLSFEDPHSMGEVRTLHGLKRYLHQQGLKLGFRLVEKDRSPNRTVNILILTNEGIQLSLDTIRYADFESPDQADSSTLQIPFSVELLVDGFARQMLHGQDRFPYVDIFCYGNEVHYYFGFRNHPAFLRIDFAPPLRGGIIDLEYFGVSNYELDQHPDISLNAIRTFFECLEFDVLIEGTRIHARYDKERALNLGDLCEKARYVFRMAAYFMDLDWIIGSLSIESAARQKVAKAWIDFFLRWGFLPLKSILSKNRTGILTGFIDEPTGLRELIWSGKGNYTDIYSKNLPTGFYEKLIKIVNKLNLNIIITGMKEKDKHPPGQLQLENIVLTPVRKAFIRGELIRTNKRLKIQSSNLFMRVHEVELFAELLASGIDKIISGIEIAYLVRPLERCIHFKTTGSINGYLVQKAVLALRGEEICFYVLRGTDGIIYLAVYIRDLVLYKKRKSASNPWISNAIYNTYELAALLRANDFVDSIPESIDFNFEAEVNQFLNKIKNSILSPEQGPLHGERIVTGLKASPGRSIGKAIFGTEGRNPQDLQGYILVAESIKPEDTTYFYYTSGIVSTGGGILSHAGLIAMQFHKPALIISGKWQTDPSGKRVLYYNSLEYKVQHQKIGDFEVCIRTDIQEKEFTLYEGDMLILDALTGSLRVLGQEREILALYEGFRLYREASELLTSIKKEKEILNLRGKRLRARHQLENILRRSANPVTARYAIFEILLNEPVSGTGMIQRDKGKLLLVLLNNSFLKSETRHYLMIIITELENNYNEAIRKAQNNIPTSNSLFEVLSLRLDTIQQKRAVDSAVDALMTCDVKISTYEKDDKEKIESITRDRLSSMKKRLIHEIKSYSQKFADRSHLHHLLDQLNRINQLDSKIEKINLTIDKLKKDLVDRDFKTRNSLADRYIIKHNEGGFELFQMIGWKAANLAEIKCLVPDDIISLWFVVTDKAFREILNSPITDTEDKTSHRIKDGLLLHEAINTILDRVDLNNYQKSMQIRGLWEHMSLPDELCQAVKQSYNEIINPSSLESHNGQNIESDYVAVRSSSQEEDTEAATRAGEFETYLYIHGEDQLLYYLKRTWSGLWTERAIHNRLVLGEDAGQAGGGVIVQRMVNSRVSGVLQTVDIPRNNLRDIVINAGLGLGEGIVSGTVAADQITVSKETDPEKEPLRFSYVTSDKIEQIVFNRRIGYGTIRSQTLYHQRLRPAMEYIELRQLVRIATSLEKAYGYPLDIEFAIEGNHLWILQARPVASFLSVFRETIEQYPIV